MEYVTHFPRDELGTISILEVQSVSSELNYVQQLHPDSAILDSVMTNLYRERSS